MSDNILPYLDERIIAEKACGLGLQVQMLCEKYAEQGRAEEVRQLRMLHDRLWAIVQEVKDHHYENQPRVPPGVPEGGQWTNEPPTPGNEGVTLVKTIEHPIKGRLHRANIFVGGANDSVEKNVKNSFSLHKETYGDNYYTHWMAADEIIALIGEMPKNRAVNLIGHSYGADTIAKIAVRIPGRVRNLITIDPVSDPDDRPKYREVQKSVGRWVNVNAIGDPETSIFTGIFEGNLVAFLGRPWNDEPKDFVDIFFEAPYNHSYFTGMMFYAPNDSKSPQDLLNE